MNGNQEYEYFAFISYCWEDEKEAKWLQNKLENYKLPVFLQGKYPELEESRIRPIFRDKTDLCGSFLKESLFESLSKSRYLIVLCSPQSANREWINMGIQNFLNMGRSREIIPFIIDGKPRSNNIDEEAFPASLLSLTGENEILGINISDSGKDEAFVKLIARLFSVKYDILWQRYKRDRRRKRFFFYLLTLVITILILFSYFKQQELNLSLQREEQITKEKILAEREVSIITKTSTIVESNAYNSEGYSINSILNLIPLLNDSDSISVKLKPDIEKTIELTLDNLINNQCVLTSVKKINDNDTLNYENIQIFNEISDENNVIVSDYEIKDEPDSLVLTIMEELDLHYPMKSWKYNKYLFIVFEDNEDDLVIYSNESNKVLNKLHVPWSWYNHCRDLDYNEASNRFIYYYGSRGDEGTIEFNINNINSPNIITKTDTSNGATRLKVSPSNKYIIKCNNKETQNEDLTYYSLLDYNGKNWLYHFDFIKPDDSFNLFWKEENNQEFIVIRYNGYDYYFKYVGNEPSRFVPQFSVRDICISNDGNLIAYTTTNDKLYIYDCKNKRHILTTDIFQCYSLNFNQNSDQLIVIDCNGELCSLYQINPFKKIAEFSRTTQYNSPMDTEIHISANNKYLFSSEWQYGFSIYALPNGEQVLYCNESDNSQFYFNNSVDSFVSIENKNAILYQLGSSVKKEKCFLDSNSYFVRANFDNYKSFRSVSDNDEFYVEVYRDDYIQYGRNPSIRIFKKLFSAMLQ